MKNIDTLSGLEGRQLLSSIYKELRYEKQSSSFSALFNCWKICVYEKEIFRYSKSETTVNHPLGIFSGTALWLEEIVNRYYFSTINSFVYFGASVLLVLIGVRRFSESVSDSMVIAGVVFEALMLLFMFVVMLFSPNELTESEAADTSHQESIEELILEVGEISRDFAAVSVNLDNIAESLTDLIKQQEELVVSVSELAEANTLAVSPNPKMLEVMTKTNEALTNLTSTVINLNDGIKLIQKSEIEFAVKKEIEDFISRKINNDKS